MFAGWGPASGHQQKAGGGLFRTWGMGRVSGNHRNNSRKELKSIASGAAGHGAKARKSVAVRQKLLAGTAFWCGIIQSNCHRVWFLFSHIVPLIHFSSSVHCAPDPNKTSRLQI